MPRWLACAVLTFALLPVLPAAAFAPPLEVVHGRPFPINEDGISGDPGCLLLINKKKVGECTPGAPLTGTFTITSTHAPGNYKLFCHPCRRVKNNSTKGSGTTGSTTTPPSTTTDPTTSTQDKTTDEQTKSVDQEPVSELSETPPAFRQAQSIGIMVREITVVAASPGTTQSAVPPAASPQKSSWQWLFILGALLAIVIGAGVWSWRRNRPRPDHSPGPATPLLPGVRTIRAGVSAPPDAPLIPGRAYNLYIDIGTLPGTKSRASVPLDIVVAGRVSDPIRRIRLGTSAAGRFEFPFTAAQFPVRFRCGLYVRGTLQQSFVIDTSPHGWRAERDYATSFGLDPEHLADVEPHAMSLMVNHNNPVERGVYAYFAGTRTPVAGQIPGHFIGFQQEQARKLYESISPTLHNRGQLASVLGQLALCGKGVYRMLRQSLDEDLYDNGLDPNEVWASIRGQGRVQVIWPDCDPQPLPAAIVYDYPLAETQKLGLCRTFFDDVDSGQAPRCADGRCLSADETVVCPAGFWGFRLMVGSPLSRGLRRPAPDAQPDRPQPPVVIIGKSTDPAFQLRDRHLHELKGLLAQTVQHEESRADTLLARWREVQPNVVYLYCHGGFDPEKGIGWFQVGDHDTLSARGLPEDFFRHWKASPLIFLNGCSTAALAANLPNSLPRWFLWAGAGGVLGTEIVVHESIACMFANVALPSMLLDGNTVGEAVLRARVELLRRGSTLGLAYVALAPADLRLVKG